MADFRQILELRRLRKGGNDSLSERQDAMSDEQVDDMLELYEFMRDAGLVTMLRADNRVYHATITPKGRRESSIPRLVARFVPHMFYLAGRFLGGFVKGSVGIAVIWCALHANMLSSIVHAM